MDNLTNIKLQELQFQVSVTPFNMPKEIISISKNMKSNIITAIQFSEIPKRPFKGTELL